MELVFRPLARLHMQATEAAIDCSRDGDLLLCTKLDRLARSVADLPQIEERLKTKGTSIGIMAPSMDTSPPNGRPIFNVIASIAQFEREVMLAGQREGIAKAKSEGKCKGRAPTARAKSDEVLRLVKEGMRATDVAKRVSFWLPQTLTNSEPTPMTLSGKLPPLLDKDGIPANFSCKPALYWWSGSEQLRSAGPGGASKLLYNSAEVQAQFLAGHTEMFF